MALIRSLLNHTKYYVLLVSKHSKRKINLSPISWAVFLKRDRDWARNGQLMQAERTNIGFPGMQLRVDRCGGARGTGTITLIYTCTLHLKYVVLRSGAGNKKVTTIENLSISFCYYNTIFFDIFFTILLCCTCKVVPSQLVSFRPPPQIRFPGSISTGLLGRPQRGRWGKCVHCLNPTIDPSHRSNLRPTRQCIERYPNVVLFEQCPRCQ